MNIVILSYLTLSTGLLYHGPKRHGGDRPEEGEAIHRSRSKVMTAAEAVARFVRPGSTLGMGGQNVGRCPMALTHEIIQQRIGDLTVVGCNLSIAMDQLVGAGLVRRTVCGSGNLERFGTTLCWRRAVEEGAVEVVDYSHLAMVTRFLAGEMGVPFMPTRSLLGSDLLRPPAAPGPAPGPLPRIGRWSSTTRGTRGPLSSSCPLSSRTRASSTSSAPTPSGTPSSRVSPPTSLRWPGRPATSS